MLMHLHVTLCLAIACYLIIFSHLHAPPHHVAGPSALHVPRCRAPHRSACHLAVLLVLAYSAGAFFFFLFSFFLLTSSFSVQSLRSLQFNDTTWCNGHDRDTTQHNNRNCDNTRRDNTHRNHTTNATATPRGCTTPTATTTPCAVQQQQPQHRTPHDDSACDTTCGAMTETATQTWHDDSTHETTHGTTTATATPNAA
jgi:hypothetical protein